MDYGPYSSFEGKMVLSVAQQRNKEFISEKNQQDDLKPVHFLSLL
jgi:hypothetical protein